MASIASSATSVLIGYIAAHTDTIRLGAAEDGLELQGFLSGKTRVPGVQAVPRAPEIVPLYLLGSSLFGAQLAARLGLPYAFASHFAPTHLHQAVEIYRATFRPSEQLAQPHVIAGANVFAAEDHDDAVRQMTIAYRARTRAMISRARWAAPSPARRSTRSWPRRTAASSPR